MLTLSKPIPLLVLAAAVGFVVAFGAGLALKKSSQPAATPASALPVVAPAGSAPKVSVTALTGGAIPALRIQVHKKKAAPAASSGATSPQVQSTPQATTPQQPAPQPSAPQPSAPAPAQHQTTPPPSGNTGGSSGGTG